MTRRPCELVEITGEPARIVRAVFVRDWPYSQLNSFERSWSPFRAILQTNHQPDGRSIEHGHWDWRFKRQSVKIGRYRLFAVECAGSVQGMMAILNFPRTSRFDPAHQLVYVDYIENAPWNLLRIGKRRRFADIGRVLMSEAIRLSVELGHDGRIGLHSLPSAAAFYRDKMEMKDFGPDSNYGNLRYFELESVHTNRWLNKDA